MLLLQLTALLRQKSICFGSLLLDGHWFLLALWVLEIRCAADYASGRVWVVNEAECADFFFFGTNDICITHRSGMGIQGNLASRHLTSALVTCVVLLLLHKPPGAKPWSSILPPDHNCSMTCSRKLKDPCLPDCTSLCVMLNR